MKSAPTVWTWVLRIARVALVAGVVTWLAYATDLGELWAALSAIPLWVFAVILVLGTGSVLIAAQRWLVVMRSFGANPLPPYSAVLKAFLVGAFYNTFVPGAVGGDVVRGVISRRNFASPAAGLFVIAVERVLGLSGLGIYFAIGLAVGPQLVSSETAAWVLGVLVALAIGLLVAAKLSGVLAKLWDRLPRVERISDLPLAFGLTLVGHATTFGIYMVLAFGLDLPIGLAALALVVPLSLIAGVLPINVAGVGAREALLVGILAQLGVAKERAIALSLGFWVVVLAIALSGGLLQLVGKGMDLHGSDEDADPQV